MTIMAIMTTMTRKIPAVLIAVCAILLPAQPGRAAEPLEMRFAYIGPDQGSSLAGVQQGISEANLQGAFLGQRYHLEVFAPGDWQEADLAGVLAVLGATGQTELLHLSALLPGVAIFNLHLTDNDLRLACYPNLLHVIPSDRMYADAREQWRQKEPGAGVEALAWHPEFLKFAARDLNKRFVKKQGRKMDDLSWAGWAAVKMSADAISRMGGGNAAALLDFLKNRLNFDGQKGIAMNFRKTGQLRQPLLLAGQGRLLGMAPVRGVAIPPTLDSLGLVGECEK